MLYFEYGVVVYYLIFLVEVLSNFVKFDFVCFGLWVIFDGNLMVEDVMFVMCDVGFGDEVKCCIIFGIYVLLVGYYDVYYGSV